MPVLSFGSYTLPVYLYENFSYTISNLSGTTIDTPITKTSGLPLSFFTITSSNITVAGNGASLTAGSSESFSYNLLDGSANVVATSSNVVPVGAGRFTDLSGNGVSGNAFVFFKNEPISPIHLMAPFNLSTAVSSVPSLPPGLSFVVSGSNLDITGTPLTTLPTSNYLLIGKDAATGSKIVTTSNTYTVSNERILYNLSGTPIINMNVGIPITTRTLTAAFPPYPSGGTLNYSWNTFPDGISVFDFNGSNRTISNNFGFNTTDPSHVFTIAGTPTLAAAYQFANANVSSAIYTVQGTRISPLPAVVSNFPFTFAFNETVLFDLSSIPTLYSGVPLDASANFFHAKTYFNTGSGTAISNIFSPDLRADLSLTFAPSSGRAYLSGTPTLGASSANYTIRAINSNLITQDYVTPITVQDDFITFVSPTPVTDTSYNFIISRPLTLPKTGYYPYPIQFKAQAASGLPVTLSAPALVGTGMFLDASGIISGFPTTPTSLTTLAVTATATGSPATATRNTKFAVLNDVFTFASVPSSNFNFVQNKPITPFQIPVTTLSERPVTGFSAINLPSGLTISPAGVISGTPLSSIVSGTITIIPTTGYSSGSALYPYVLTPDTILFTLDQNVYTYPAGANVVIPITGNAFSGTSVSNYSFTLDPGFGLAISPTSGLLSGTLSDSIPPNFLIPPSTNFVVNAIAGGVTGVLNSSITANPAVVFEQFMAYFDGSVNQAAIYDCQNDYLTWNQLPFSLNFQNICDIKVKNNSPSNNVVLMSTNSEIVYQGTTVGGIHTVDMHDGDLLPVMTSLANKTGTSTWWTAGFIPEPAGEFGQNPLNNWGTVLRSDDDGLTWNTAVSTTQLLIDGTPFETRDSNGVTAGFSQTRRPYARGGAALAYNSGVLMLGGLNLMGRSTDDGASWHAVSGSFVSEIANFSLDAPGMWICTGSDQYVTTPVSGNVSFSSSTTTIKYSTDQGASWNNASGGFTMFGYEVAYGSNTWLATGMSGGKLMGNPQYTAELRYSTNGTSWSLVNLGVSIADSPVTGPSVTPEDILAPLQIQSISFDGTHWNVAVTRPIVSGNSKVEIYRHDLTSSLATGWVLRSSPVLSTPYKPRMLACTAPRYMLTNPGDISVQISFQTTTGNGPTLTSPTQASFLFYQYITITPIQLSATGTGQIYFFVVANDLPAGLTFDPITNLISGTPAQLGSSSVTIRIKDNNGITSFVLNFTVILARIVRKQDGAGAYTSLLRQYTDVLGAQNARDSRVFPNQTLGEFTSPDAPDVVTAIVDPKCANPNC